MITEKQIEEHLAALEGLGPKLASSRADAEFASDILRTVYANEYLKAEAPRAADKEAMALASDAYKAALTEKRRAMIESETLRHERAWRERVIEAWQTLSANNRGRI